MANKVKGNRKINSNSSQYNAISFMVENIIKGKVCTALPVKVVGVNTTGPGQTGFVDVLPLIESYDNFDEKIPAQVIYNCPYCRIQGGVATLVIDPIIGDIGIAIFAQQDITGVNSEPQKPLTKRSFSMADAMYIGGIVNKEPTIYIELTQDNICNIIAPSEVNIKTTTCFVECETMEVQSATSTLIEAGNQITLKAPQINLLGNLSQSDVNGGAGTMTITGDIVQNGKHNSTGDQVAGGVSQINHTHGGVTPGGGDTGVPNK